MRARSSSPGRAVHHAELWRKYLYHPTLDDRIHLQMEMDAWAERHESGGNNSQEIPPSPPPTKERKMELPLLLRVPPPRGAHSPHIPATVTPAAAAAQRQTRPTSPRVRSFVPSGKAYPGTAIRTTSTRPSTPRLSGGMSSKAAAARGTAPHQSPLERQQSTSRQPPPRRQSPTRDASGYWRSVSLRGHCQASRSCSSGSYGKSKHRREHDRGNRR